MYRSSVKRWCSIAHLKSVKSRCHAKDILNQSHFLCETRDFFQQAQQNAMLLELIKGRYAAFFFSLQCINILVEKRITGIQP
ncbi:hypothetical protein EKN76_11700 [Enterobacter bugandensis]|uniref:Uncharacterized protein n=1 Tax=Enterobacter bugandensis TaxID=881260 RepID=A0ABX4VL97_9ENTR|nr:hypothetical protein CYJ92_18715 [Enterobacter bugandensis]PLA86668.1 hypothetical protein CYK27_18625 [Enterobacter bugandensis]PNF46136.1 hypothetical protein C1166_09840 [Enterobacter bugandensis]PNF55615.1 hypothetical protein C1169_14290 [Enterobacter bugandensis]PNF64404.1 hypothetical protein C1168_14290 [Enterobacter bugandensis]